VGYGAAQAGEAPALQIGNEVAGTLQRHGLKTSWDWTWANRIGVQLDWKRRLPGGLAGLKADLDAAMQADPDFDG
jgi:hypothetical protein